MVDQTIAPDEVASGGVDDTIQELTKQFPDAVQADGRSGFGGVVVDKNRLVEVATYIRDNLGYDYLSSATAVDYLAEAEPDSDMEMVYHAFRTTGGSALVFKAQTPRDNAEIPSLIDVWPGADFQEREAYDLMGIKFPGHPNLKRILMWDGFEGHPLRKDFPVKGQHRGSFPQGTVISNKRREPGVTGKTRPGPLDQLMPRTPFEVKETPLREEGNDA